ncbi:MAG: hypothetical protein M0R68_10390 [Bacteroidetes bacterium]|nr:hypothetical protein [Bacteroidota bacterium]
MNRTITMLLVLMLMSHDASAQDTTNVESTTTEENIALIAIAGIVIPFAIIGTVVSAIPPSISIVMIDGVQYGAFAIESGFGIGEKRETAIFSDWRIGLSYTFVVNSNVRNLFRTELKRDFHFNYVDRRKIFLSGLHISAGLLTDFPKRGFTFGTGVWLKSPWIGYFGFIPEHTYGLTYRYNRYFNGKEFHEISVGMTSAFTF